MCSINVIGMLNAISAISMHLTQAPHVSEDPLANEYEIIHVESGEFAIGLHIWASVRRSHAAHGWIYY